VFEDNLKAELEAGKPLKQALAIAYSKKREAEKAQGKSITPKKGGSK
jgi:hypothetical protein